MRRFFLLLFAVQVFCLHSVSGAGGSPEYLPYFNPAKGFKPAQTNLTNVFLQLAGSMEHSGSPERYLRHVQSEHARILQLYRAKTGREAGRRLPVHMTPEYVERLVGNWNALAPKLQLSYLGKEAGRCARESILGTRDTGTIVIEVFNQHQKLVAKQMRGEGVAEPVGFEQLRQKLETELEFDKETVSMHGYETARRDAVSYAVIFRGVRDNLFERIDATLPAAKAREIEGAINGVFLDLGRMAHAELELGILEWSLQE